jgi:hypothetical protein
MEVRRHLGLYPLLELIQEREVVRHLAVSPLRRM